jgi:DNA replication protein
MKDECGRGERLKLSNHSEFRTSALEILNLGSAPIPGLLLRSYARLGLTEIEVMLIIHLIYYDLQEKINFPTPQQLADRMSTPISRVLTAIEKLVREHFVHIEEYTEEGTGKYSERYELKPLYEKMIQLWVDESSPTPPSPHPTHHHSSEREQGAKLRKSLFALFESEFARLLSPIEYENIVKWLDEDQYSEPLIRAALKEAVFAGKVHFRYIDRILMDWQRNRISTPEEAKTYSERFRN